MASRALIPSREGIYNKLRTMAQEVHHLRDHWQQHIEYVKPLMPSSLQYATVSATTSIEIALIYLKKQTYNLNYRLATLQSYGRCSDIEVIDLEETFHAYMAWPRSRMGTAREAALSVLPLVEADLRETHRILVHAEGRLTETIDTVAIMFERHIYGFELSKKVQSLFPLEEQLLAAREELAEAVSPEAVWLESLREKASCLEEVFENEGIAQRLARAKTRAERGREELFKLARGLGINVGRQMLISEFFDVV